LLSFAIKLKFTLPLQRGSHLALSNQAMQILFKCQIALPLLLISPPLTLLLQFVGDCYNCNHSHTNLKEYERRRTLQRLAKSVVSQRHLHATALCLLPHNLTSSVPHADTSWILGSNMQMGDLGTHRVCVIFKFLPTALFSVEADNERSPGIEH